MNNSKIKLKTNFIFPLVFRPKMAIESLNQLYQLSDWLRAANFSALIGQHFTIVRGDGWKKGQCGDSEFPFQDSDNLCF